MNDIVERLRDESYSLPSSSGPWFEMNGSTYPRNVCTEAADEIERMRNQLKNCGKENCMGWREGGDGVAMWVREERLLNAQSEITALRAEIKRLAALLEAA